MTGSSGTGHAFVSEAVIASMELMYAGIYGSPFIYRHKPAVVAVFLARGACIL